MFGGLALPFTVTEMITGAWELVTLVGPYLAIGIAFMLAPKFIAFIKGIFAGRGSRA